MNNYSVNVILAKMATHIYADLCRYPVYTNDGLFYWENPDNAFRFVSEKLLECDDCCEIVIFGTDHVKDKQQNVNVEDFVSGHEYVQHALIIDNINGELHDLYGDKIAVYENEDYKLANVNIGRELFRMSVGEFKETFFSDAEYFSAETASVQLSFSDGNYEEDTLDFLFCAYVIFKYVLTEDPASINAPAISVLSDKIDVCKKFLTKYKIGYRLFLKICTAISQKKPYNEQMEELVTQFGKDLKKGVPFWTRNNKIGKDALNGLKAFGTFLRKRDSVSAKNWLLANVNKMHSRTLVQLFSDAKSLGVKGTDIDLKASQQELLKQIKEITKKLVGNPVVGLSADNAKKAREKNPELYAQYRKLRTALINSSSAFLRLKVRQSGQRLVDYEKTIQEMNNEGVRHNYPEGFVGYLDEDGFLYTTAKKKIAAKPTARVTMNPNYNPATDDTYVFSIQSPTDKTKVIHFRTEDFAKNRVKLKSEAVSILGARLKTIRNKWSSKIGYKKRENLVASILELIYVFAARVGKIGNMTGGEPTFGMSTILVKHVKKQGTNYVFSYPGKKGTTQSYILKPSHTSYKKLSEVLDHQMKDKKPNDYIWTYSGSLIPKSAIDSMWKSLDSATAKVGVHKIRNAEATKMAKDILAKHPFNNKSSVSQAEVEKWYKEAMKKVGAVLQHQTGGTVTSTTAIKSYIDAELQKEFFTGLGLRVPDFVPKVR